MKSRITALLIYGVFALGFGLPGIFFAIPLTKSLHELWLAQSYEAVPAKVLHAELIYGNKGTRSIKTKYRYTFNGQAFESTRLGLFNQGSDNIGTWHDEWIHRLHKAIHNDSPITVWVNPQHPQQALIDRSIRWPKLFFSLPFAILFPAVGFGALWAFFKLLRTPPDKNTPVAIKSNTSSAGILHDDSIADAIGTWIFTCFWNLIAWPIAALVWSTQNGMGINIFASLFPVVGLFLLWFAIKASIKAIRVRGTELLIQPVAPSIGKTLKVVVSLQASRISSSQQFEMNLAESRIRDSDDKPTPHEVWSTRQHPLLQLQADGSGRLQAEFAIPAQCMPTDKMVDGLRTVWSLSLLDLEKADMQNYDITVFAGNAFGASMNDASKMSEPGILTIQGDNTWTTAGESPSFVPARVMQISESGGRWIAQFSMRISRWSGVFWLLSTISTFLLARESFLSNDSTDVIWSVLWILAACISLWLSINQLSKTWRLIIDQHGISVQRGSWMHSRNFMLAREEVENLQKKFAKEMPNSAGYRSHFQIHALTRNGDRIQLTPGIPWTSVADGVAYAIKTALFNKAKLLAFNKSAAETTPYGKLAGWFLYAVLAIAGIAATSLNPTFLPGDPVSLARIMQDWKIRLDRLAPSGRQYGEFATAQEKGDLPAIEALLKNGSNPNAVANNGTTYLMLAARRGDLEHVNLLLRYGANVNQRDETSNDNRGDTALLVALHSGHEQIAFRLLDAGARLDVVNMWDWTPMHMAAQSYCVPCLDLLLHKGQSIHAKAHASRGETPAMLAAGKGRVATLEWFVKHGADLEEKDPYGNNALDWAIFFHQEDTERWIRDYMKKR